MQRFKVVVASLVTVASFATLLAVAQPVAAYQPFQSLCAAAGAAASPACKTTGKDPLTGGSGLLTKVAILLALITGIASVIVVIIGGLQYITAGGDANKAESARRMIMGAVIGLVITALAGSLIAFVLNRIT